MITFRTCHTIYCFHATFFFNMYTLPPSPLLYHVVKVALQTHPLNASIVFGLYSPYPLAIDHGHSWREWKKLSRIQTLDMDARVSGESFFYRQLGATRARIVMRVEWQAVFIPPSTDIAHVTRSGQREGAELEGMVQTEDHTLCNAFCCPCFFNQDV